MKTMKWAILGTGYIADSFANAMNSDILSGTEKAAVCGISLEEARSFGEKHGIKTHFDNFDRMLEEISPDVAYIAVPNMLHYQFVMKALERGINVLCEKPMADNEWQLQDMLKKAEEKGVFLMEGMWTRCFPATRKLCEWLEAGKIGNVKSVRADFGLKAVEGWQGWKASASHAGGALRDVGIYCLAWAFLAFNGESPLKIHSVCRMKNNADYHDEMLLHFSQERTAYITASFDMVTNHSVSIYGENGVITVGPRLWCPQQAELFMFDPTDEFTRKKTESFEDNHLYSGMQYEISHVNECIRSSKRESPYFSLKETLAIARLIDSLRKEWGVRYPSDDHN